MTRSSKRQARRWVIQELTRCLEQRSEPLPLNQAGCGLIMSNARARATSHVMDNEIEAKAKALCADAGCDPGETVMHAYGDDFTVLEWQYRWTSNTAISGQPMISPMWRLYRARAVIELSRLPKAVEIGGNVIPFRRRNS